ncbi:hypothetical protein NSE_0599 [Neorickettsia sennetsu str. Miyayama]|uniref:Uncharacterized protein n=1 Tax=Ehrlichia sennetsu (strain ATCC VR-367 / Miyayama) TaxID=222891 RepID=Q2GDG7_EHRS3|nr:hypothetical protein NSE_0599 [Neorickettsia sennetsu str. Miyayama]
MKKLSAHSEEQLGQKLPCISSTHAENKSYFLA